MVSSAVYRYFPSRDDLLTALIIDAYDDIGAAAEVGMASGLPDDPTGRWLGLCGGVRRWALHHPAEYALVYGSPVPGYAAPQDTIGPATRVSLAMVRLVVETAALHGLAPTPPLDDVPPPAALLPDLDAMRATLDTDLSDGVFLRGLAARTHLFGAITFELFGQHQNLISDNEAFFLHAMRLTARMIGLPIAGGAS